MKLDHDLNIDVMNALQWDPALQKQALAIKVSQGIVVLSGVLESHAEKRAIERALEQVVGLRAAVFETEVRLGEPGAVPDLAIAQACVEALRTCSGVPHDDIRPIVEQGWVTLRGRVGWEFERRSAERAVRELKGVAGVSNGIELHPVAMAGEVERNVQDALLREAHREGRRIEIAVDGSRVTLRGCVHSDAERHAVSTAAWATPGVEAVVDALSIRA